VIDLSYVAAYKLGMLGPGSAEVVVERITPDQIRNWQAAPATLNVATATNAPVQTQAVAQGKPNPEQTQPANNSDATAPVALAAAAMTTTVAARPNVSATLPSPVDKPAQVFVPPPAASTTPTATRSINPSTSASAAPPGSMYLQLGAFSEASKAQALAARVSSQIPAELSASVRVEQTTNNLHRVRIGPFASREAAVQAVNPVQTSTGVAPSLSPP
jgi:rare lipoprotein A